MRALIFLCVTMLFVASPLHADQLIWEFKGVTATGSTYPGHEIPAGLFFSLEVFLDTDRVAMPTGQRSEINFGSALGLLTILGVDFGPAVARFLSVEYLGDGMTGQITTINLKQPSL